jgi:hypothetical protein
MKSLTLLLMVFYASSIFAQTSPPCAEPVGANAEAFNLIINKANSELEALLKKNKDLNSAQNKYCERLYHVAIRARNEDARKILDRMGYGPRNSKRINEEYEDMQIFSRNSYFSWAVKFGLPETYDDLKKRGGVHFQYGDTTDLTWAVEYCNDSGLTSHLVSKGFDVDGVGSLEGTPLNRATQKCSFKVIEELVQNGADVNYQANPRMGPMGPLLNSFKRYVEKKVDISYLQVLMNGRANLNLVFGTSTLLMMALDIGNFELVKFLVESGADVNFMTYNGSPLLNLLGLTRKTEDLVVILLEYLISSGADVNLPGTSNQYPIHQAGYNSRRVVEVLLKNGADINVKTNYGSTILHGGVPCKWPKEDIEWLVTLFRPGSITLDEHMNRPSDMAFRCNRGREIVEILKKIER